MSTDYWWWLCHLSKEEEDYLFPRFTAPEQESDNLNKARILLKSQQNKTSCFEEHHLNNKYNELVSLFIIHHYQELGESIVSPDGFGKFKLSEKNCFDFISINRCPSGAILWFSLGPDLAETLPGFMGNIFVRKNKIESTLSCVEKVFSEIDYSTLLSRAQSLIPNSSAKYNADLVLKALPRGLKSAQEKGCGFMALSMHAV